MANVILTGATGMVGFHALETCIAHPKVDRITVVGRRTTGIDHPKVKEVIVKDFDRLDADHPMFKGIDVVIFCMGVYTGAVPKDVFRKVTAEYPVTFGKAVLAHNKNAVYCLLSGQGADRKEKSQMAFAKYKGMAENQLDALGFKAFHSFRPAYIYPVVPRKEPNWSYRLSRRLYKPIFSKLGANAHIKSTDLAAAMVEVGLNGHELTILENRDIRKISPSS